MSSNPGSSRFPPPVEPSPLTRANNKKPRDFSSTDLGPEEERKANLKVAFCFFAVALLFILEDWIGRVKHTPESNASSLRATAVTLAIHPQMTLSSEHGRRVQFRLSNMGNHPVFYPVCRASNVPVGEIVYRTSESSSWLPLPADLSWAPAVVPQHTDSNVTWIEMPPGGWVDGKFRDPGGSPMDHAYGIYLKTERNVRPVLMLSEPYQLPK